MDIVISNSNPKPIYEQITDQVKNQIITGALAPGDALPSMRLLAKDLHISVITTKRAYSELERDGFRGDGGGQRLLRRAEKPRISARGTAPQGGRSAADRR